MAIASLISNILQALFQLLGIVLLIHHIRRSTKTENKDKDRSRKASEHSKCTYFTSLISPGDISHTVLAIAMNGLDV